VDILDRKVGEENEVARHFRVTAGRLGSSDESLDALSPIIDARLPLRELNDRGENDFVPSFINEYSARLGQINQTRLTVIRLAFRDREKRRHE
jgi:hypothetical protein